MQPVKLLERAAGGAAQAIRHPIASAAYGAGIVRGLAGAGRRALSGSGDEDGPQRVAPQRTAPKETPPVAGRDDVPPPTPTPPRESFATEPKATSRDSEHGRVGSDAEIDEWGAEADDVDIETPVGTTGADVGHNPDTAEADLQQPGTEPLLDPSTAKSIRSEAEMMQKAADPEKE